MARVIAIANQKGGVGKSTTTLALGAELARLGHPTLLVDIDPQGHLAEGLGISSLSLEHELSDVFEGSVSLSSITRQVRPNLYLAPTNLKLAYLEPHLITQIRREDKLKDALAPVAEDYEIVLIDCPPSMGILTVNAFSAATEVLIPMAAEFFALVGVSMLLDSLAKMRSQLNPTLSVAGIVPTRVTHTRHALEVIDQAKAQLQDRYRFFAPIPEGVAVKDAAAAGVPVTEYQPESKPAQGYRQLAQEICQ